MQPFSLYIHIPYCHHKCPYCDFNTYVQSEVPQEQYVLSLLEELDYYSEQAPWKNGRLVSIYFGGGTPTLFDSKLYRRLLYTILSRFDTEEFVEITIEANPNDLTLEVTNNLVEIGFNRLSIGSQSFQEKTLKTLGRIHSPEQIVEGVENARSAGFGNLSLDFIYGIPKQTLEELHSDLRTFLDIQIPHASLYTLSVEKGTEFYDKQGKGKFRMPSDALVLDMMKHVRRILVDNGYNHYEISNFSLPNFHSRHNSSYWNGTNYLGLGAGAHSMCEAEPGVRTRWSNIAKPNEYIGSAQEKRSASAWSEEISGADLAFEFLFLGLRQLEGVSLVQFENAIGQSIFDIYPGIVEVLLGSGFLKHKGDTLALTEKGLFVADSVIENFLPESPAVDSSTLSSLRAS